MITYRQLAPSEANQLIALVRSSYGESYPYSLLYDSALLARKLEDQTLISSVAFNEDGQLIGHVGLCWHRLEDKTPDSMTAIVLEQYQRQGILAKLTRQMGQLIEGREIIGLHSYAVTTHTGSQKNGLQRGSFETGFLIPEFPATMAAKGIQSDCLGDKNPALTLYTPLTKPETRNCYVIASYRDAINEIYCRVGYSRIVLTSGHDKLPEISETIVDSDKRKGVERLEFKSIGKDWKTVSQHIREAAKASDHNAGYYIDIPVSQAAAIPLAQLLKSEQWCFGCILFERNNGDYLRMQYSKAKINRESLRLETAEAARLMHDVLDERKKTLKHPA